MIQKFYMKKQAANLNPFIFCYFKIRQIGFIVITRAILFVFISFLSFCLPVSAEVVDKIVAIVNNDIITLVQLNKGTEIYRQKIEASSYSDQEKNKMMEKIDLKILNVMIDNSLTHQEAKKYRINVSENSIDKAIETMMQTRSLTKEELEKALKLEGLTIDEYRENIRKQMLQNKLINHAVKSKVIVMESDIKKYYQEHTEKYSANKKYHLRNILMNDEDEIKKIRNNIDGKNSFITYAQNNSIAPNAEDGGDLGFFDIASFSDNIKKEISKLQKNQLTDVISTARGFQLFYVEDIVDQSGKAYDSAYDEIHKILYDKQMEKKFKTWLESLKTKAHIRIML